MINKWILNNFKSIDREKDLEFRPLTIFTGANSSGKSTILQSILLVAQTLQNKTATRSVVLNGWFKKFGSYTDIVYGRDINKNIEIGFSLSDEHRGSSEYAMYANMMRMGLDMEMVPWEVREETKCVFELSSNGKKDNLQPDLEKVTVTSSRDGKELENMEVSKFTNRTEVEQDVYNTIKDKFSKSDLQYTIKGNYTTRRRYGYEQDVPMKPIGVRLNHFMPEVVLSYATTREIAKIALKNYLLVGEEAYYYNIDFRGKVIIQLIKDRAIEITKKLYEQNLVRLKNPEKNYSSIIKNFTLKKFQTILRACALGEDEKLKYINSITEKLNALPKDYHVTPYYIHGNSDLEGIRNFFISRINYLGPLREEPKSLYPLSNDGSTTEVGLKGENTAAVYENNKSEYITYIAPSSFDSNIVRIKEKHSTLATAVNEWLRYMGVAKDVATDDKGKIGHSMQISNDLNIKQDLTHVGVGVSQVLPILVMCLLAQKGDVIILEQPELHLHPRVQTRLADFFVAMNALGKQCIIETHSEYLINRLRYFVAISDDTTIAKDTMIYFVEKEDGHSVYRPVTINEYGVIEEWPDGFFDEAQKMSAAILEEGMKKRMRELNIEEDED